MLDGFRGSFSQVSERLVIQKWSSSLHEFAFKKAVPEPPQSTTLLHIKASLFPNVENNITFTPCVILRTWGKVLILPSNIRFKFA